jgi:2-oxoglutarate dehydrogenase complex dehydrogenase (E1) component-like enzyme
MHAMVCRYPHDSNPSHPERSLARREAYRQTQSKYPFYSDAAIGSDRNSVPSLRTIGAAA